jgi:hypothetical protein
LLIVFDCPPVIETYVDFTCNITMQVPPRRNYTDHNVTVTIADKPIMNLIFGNNTAEFRYRIDTAENYTVKISEANYESQISLILTVKRSNIKLLANKIKK